jgi:serine/threonine-protein kinase
LSQTGPLPKIGEVIGGKYKIERLIGKGAMGAVFAARHELLQKQVAIKLMTEEHASTPQAVTRFFNEARAAAGIEGEHVARVLDVGQLEDGAPFMAIELLEGADLSQVLEKRGPLPVLEVVDWILQALEALAEAHSLGIVHRDLKPANLFLARRRDGTSLVKVLDFGISKQPPATPAVPSITATRALLGSPMYMAPEQLRSARAVDARADIWAIGVVLYELIAGRLPFQAENVAELFVAVLEHTPLPLQTLRADVPDGLQEVVMRCLSKETAERYENVADLAEALQRFAEGGTHASVQRIRYVWQTAPQWTRSEMTSLHLPPRQRSRIVAVAVAGVLVGAGIAGTMHLLASKRATASGATSIPAGAPAGRSSPSR